jgi:hypothetical protein
MDAQGPLYELSGSSELPLRKKLIINVALTGNFSMKSVGRPIASPEEARKILGL